MIGLLGVNYSDRVILGYLREVLPADAELMIGNAEISSATGVPDATLRRALSRLQRAGVIQRHRTYDRYTYRLINDSEHRSIRR
jgi:DNA-binding IclR family transcriptional regulator